ncbi:MAG TPA: hypothetical protein VGF20_14135 [Candidatus Acidoferrum sp.]
MAAQLQRGHLRLEERDPAGGGVAARGGILSQGNEFQRTFQVASAGNYLRQALPFGVYRLSVQVEGFAAWSDAVEVHSILPLKVDVLLDVAPVTTRVQVNDEKALVDPTTTGNLIPSARRFCACRRRLRKEISMKLV